MKAKRSAATDVVLLQHHLTALHLPTVKAECEQLARQCAAENLDYLGFLLRLCERELADREQRACQRRLKAARFPQLKSIDDFDFTAQPSLKRALVLELARCEFIERHESLRMLMEWLADRFADAPVIDDSIDWEDGEDHDEPHGPAAL